MERRGEEREEREREQIIQRLRRKKDGWQSWPRQRGEKTQPCDVTGGERTAQLGADRDARQISEMEMGEREE